LRLTERIITISGQHGGKLLIPFAGSGTEIIAGLKHDMKVVAFEINNEYYELANRRINAYLQSKKETLFNDK
jgi:site-specific DNA-methyltransferase (adenine-specific)